MKKIHDKAGRIRDLVRNLECDIKCARWALERGKNPTWSVEEAQKQIQRALDSIFYLNEVIY